MKVLVCGDTEDREKVWWALYGFPKGTEVISDSKYPLSSLVDSIAIEFNWVHNIYIGDLQEDSGPRNQAMVGVEKPEFVMVFHSDMSKDPNVVDIARKAKQKGIAVIVIR